MRTTLRSLTTAVVAAILMLGLTQTASAVVATGGNATNDVGVYRIHVFTNSATANSFGVTVTGNVEVLVVAGGGGGGNAFAGGGGAGGLLYTNSYAVCIGSTNVAVGGGGAGGATASGSGGGNGTNSVFGLLLAYAGGGGAGWSTVAPQSGGSGGGGYAGTTGAMAIATSPSQGNNGGAGGQAGGYIPGGGGGGAGSVGTNGATTYTGGDGGIGLSFSQFGSVAGDTNYPGAGWFAGGGGGGTYNGGTRGNGGKGGGGNAGAGGTSNPGFAGQAGTGGGGGSGAFAGSYGGGGKGGSGIVLVRYVAVPVIQNLPATNVTASSAWMNGYLAATGADANVIAVYWGTTDGGAPTSGVWAATNTISGGPWAAGASVTYQATGLTANATYYYRYYATNGIFPGWAASSEHFLAGNLTVANTDTAAAEPAPDGSGADTGILTIQRDPSATNDALTVYYWWAGTSVQGMGYTASPAGTNVTLPAGVASTNITITPLWDPTWSAGNRTVWLVLSSGEYGIGTPASNLVTITKYPWSDPLGANVTTNAGDWNGAIWSLGRRPMAGDDVTVKHAVTLSNSTDYLNSFAITNATLTFTNWATQLRVSGDATIQGSGKLACAGPFVNNAMSNRVYVVCSNLTIDGNGSVNVDFAGYAGGVGVAGNGPGAGAADNAASHGGKGGNYGGGTGSGATYGLTNAPVAPGSGGGGWNTSPGGSGGSAVRIVASGTVTVNGSVSANAQGSGTQATGAGSGGSIFITTHVLAGNGTISARGGRATNTTTPSPGGGGGRIAVVYDTATQSTSAVPGIVFTAAGEIGTGTDGDAGTLYFSDNSFLKATFIHSGEWWVDGFTNWAPANLFVSNGWLRIGQPGFRLSVTNAITVWGASSATNKLEITNNPSISCASLNVTNTTLTLGGAAGALFFNCTGDAMLANGARVYVTAGMTNTAQTNYGAFFGVTGTLRVAANAFIYPKSQPINGGSVWFQVGSVRVDSGGSINADARGYGNSASSGYGPGGGALDSGGGYGGRGGNYSGNTGGGPTYGSSNAPIDPGSAGGAWSGNGGGGYGGGLIRITAMDTVDVSGTLSAKGGAAGDYAGGGSGGGIYVVTHTLSGSGSLNADGAAGGGPNHGAGGGGGRIAVWRVYDNPSPRLVTASANGGSSTGKAGTNGTIVWMQLPAQGTIISLY